MVALRHCGQHRPSMPKIFFTFGASRDINKALCDWTTQLELEDCDAKGQKKERKKKHNHFKLKNPFKKRQNIQFEQKLAGTDLDEIAATEFVRKASSNEFILEFGSVDVAASTFVLTDSRPTSNKVRWRLLASNTFLWF